MKWTVIVAKGSCFSHSFTFIGSHSKSVAFEQAEQKLSAIDEWHDDRYWLLQIIAIVPGDHPVYHPSMDE